MDIRSLKSLSSIASVLAELTRSLNRSLAKQGLSLRGQRSRSEPLKGFQFVDVSLKKRQPQPGMKTGRAWNPWVLVTKDSGSNPKARPKPRPPNVPLLRARWSLLDFIWGLLKGSWGVLEIGVPYIFPPYPLYGPGVRL